MRTSSLEGSEGEEKGSRQVWEASGNRAGTALGAMVCYSQSTKEQLLKIIEPGLTGHLELYMVTHAYHPRYSEN